MFCVRVRTTFVLHSFQITYRDRACRRGEDTYSFVNNARALVYIYNRSLDRALDLARVLSAAIRGPTMTASATRCVAAGDKQQRQWNDKRNDKQERVNKGPARAEKRTSARQARVAYNHPTTRGTEGGGLTAGWHEEVAERRECVRDDRQRYRIHSGRDIAARFTNFQASPLPLPPITTPLPPPHGVLHAFRSPPLDGA